jgi:DNA-directed RNA polymerase specialized sigma subunit
MEQKRAQAEGELRQQLGRKPTEDELLAHLGIAGTPRTTGPVL